MALLAGQVFCPTISSAQDLRERALPIEAVMQIGEEAGDDAYTFHRISEIAVARDGSIYVLDGGDRRVAVYDDKGRFRRHFGRGGQGPGEFVRPLSLIVDTAVHVYDAAQNRVSIFSLDGTHRATHRLPSGGDLNLTFVRRLANGAYFGATTARFSHGNPAHDPNIALVTFRRGGTKIDTVGVYHSGGTVWHDAARGLPWGVAGSKFGAGGAWAIFQDSVIAVADGYNGRVVWYRAAASGLERALSAQLGVRGKPITPGELRALEHAVRADRSRRLGDIRLVTPPAWSAVTAALFADNGDLWVRTRDPRQSGSTDVWWAFSRGSRTTRKVVVPEDFHLRAVRGSLLYGLSTTENGAPVVRVYRVRGG